MPNEIPIYSSTRRVNTLSPTTDSLELDLRKAIYDLQVHQQTHLNGKPISSGCRPCQEYQATIKVIQSKIVNAKNQIPNHLKDLV